MTNDIAKATDENAIHACVLNVKGRISADIFISADGDSFLVDSDPEMREALSARLERYVIADDVQIEDVTDEFALFHSLGEIAPDLGESVRVVRSTRYGMAGFDLWLRRAEHDDVAARLALVDEASAEVFRIERGLPRWGRELTEEIIPTEANLEESAIDYGKGCYIGQEVISRIKMSGQTNKRLVGLVSLGDVLLPAGSRLTSADGKDIGWITSATRSERLGRQIGLGFVKRGFNDLGSELTTAETGERVEVVALPFR